MTKIKESYHTRVEYLRKESQLIAGGYQRVDHFLELKSREYRVIQVGAIGTFFEIEWQSRA